MQFKISDVARLAGVSSATVSRVINGTANVDETLRGKVLKAMSELQYEPNRLAQSLRKKRSMIVGVTASDIGVSFFPHIIKEIERGFQPKGYAVFSTSTYDQPENERKILRQMVARQVDALVVCSTGYNEALLKEIADSGTPVILYDRRPINGDLPAVFVNKRLATYMALDHLVNMGHRRIMLISGPKTIMSNRDRHMGLEKYVRDHSADSADIMAEFGSFSADFGMEVIERLLAMPDRPTAVVTGSVAITAGIMVQLKNRNLSIPDDLAIVSSGTFSYPDIVEPRLTYIDDSGYEIAAKLLDLLTTLLDGGGLESSTQIELEPVLRVGSSSKR